MLIQKYGILSEPKLSEVNIVPPLTSYLSIKVLINSIQSDT